MPSSSDHRQPQHPVQHPLRNRNLITSWISQDHSLYDLHLLNLRLPHPNQLVECCLNSAISSI